MKLTDMQAIVDRATKRPWHTNKTTVSAGDDDDGTDIADCAMSAGRAIDPATWEGAIADSTAIIALANHADALLELWRACQAMATAQTSTDDHWARRAILAVLAKLESIP